MEDEFEFDEDMLDDELELNLPVTNKSKGHNGVDQK